MAAVVALALLASPAHAQEYAYEPTQEPTRALINPSTAVDMLRKGGFVIFFRHTTIEHKASESESLANLERCETQRNLSPAGRTEATEIGKAFKALGIPVGNVLTSPLCRCKDVAQLAFGRYTISNDLYFAMNLDASQTRKVTERLRRMLSTLPQKTTNTIIISHTANLREAAGIWPKPEGVAYVFRPMPDGRFEAIAKVLPEEWIKVARQKQIASPP